MPAAFHSAAKAVLMSLAIVLLLLQKLREERRGQDYEIYASGGSASGEACQ